MLMIFVKFRGYAHVGVSVHSSLVARASRPPELLPRWPRSQEKASGGERLHVGKGLPSYGLTPFYKRGAGGISRGKSVAPISRIAPRGGSIRATTLVIWLFASCNALAQTPSASMPPLGLKNIPAAAGECKRQDAAPPTTPKPAKVDTVRPDLSCAIAPADLSVLLKRPDTVLADVRPAADFAAFHINGAMNLTATELRSKPFLKSKTLVLIGNGMVERGLYADCARLKASGFKQTKVLRGGLPVWLSAGQAVLGRAPDTTKTALLGPVELWAEARFDANLVLVSSNRKDLLHDLPTATTIPDVNLAAVQTAIKQHGKKPLAAVVLVAATPEIGTGQISRHSGMDRRNPDYREVNLAETK